MFLSFMGDEAGGIKMFPLLFLYLFSFVMLIPLSFRDLKDLQYHRAQELNLLPCFLPSPNVSLPLERATKCSPFFLACFVECNTVLPGYRFWNGVIGGDFLSVSLCLPQELTSPCTVRHSSQLRGLLLFPTHEVCEVWESCFTWFCFRPSKACFSIIRMTLELKDTFQARLLILRN